jgi:ribonuclease HII
MRTPIPLHPDLSFELPLWQAGLSAAGLDEAGRGAWAGPVAAAAVILPADSGILSRLNGVRDSKQMTAFQRTHWAAAIRAEALAWGVGLVSNTEIDELGILPATRLAMMRALEQLACPPGHLLLDAVRLKQVALPQTALIHGDARSLSIAAASVLAKTGRDALMTEFDREYPWYGFARHKGYGTAAHRKALEQHGPCALHRFNFRPLKDWAGNIR